MEKQLIKMMLNKKFYNEGVLWNEIKEWLNKAGFKNTKEITGDEEDILFLRK